MRTKCVYHSRIWDALVEQGWVTMYVDAPHPAGHRMCTMIRKA